MTIATTPTLAGFLAFIRNQMQISTTVLPDSSPSIEFAYTVAVAIANIQLASVPPIYMLAVYNLAGSNLVNFAQDIPDAPVVEGSDPPLPYFAWLRNKWDIGTFLPGFVTSSADESTSQSLTVSKVLENMSLAELQYMKDPWGRQYLALAARYGSLVGIS